MEFLFSPELLMALVTLTALETVLGIDNMVFVSILSGRLPEHQQRQARLFGLAGAMLTRIGLLFSLSWVMSLTTPLFTFMAHAISGRDLILIAGGLFLIYKSVTEIYHKVEGSADAEQAQKVKASLAGTIAQIMVIDIVFSLDSVITAVGMVNNLPVMVTAIVISMAIMMLSAERISSFIHKHPPVKILALSFLLLIGVLLTGEGLGQHIEKGYVYFAMAFSLIVELVNLRYDKKQNVAAVKNSTNESK